MHRGSTRKMRNLLPARHTRRDERVARGHRARGWQQLALADLPREIVVLPAVTERSGHPTASGIE